MAGIFRAGQFELREAKLVSSSGEVVDITLSTLSVTIFEDINKFTLTGSVIVQDAINLGSFFPLIGQEYLLLKLATASAQGEEVVMDFTKNALNVTNISSRVDTGSGVQAYSVNFVSRELLVDQRVRVNQSLTGSTSDIVKSIYQNILGTSKKLFIEPTADVKKLVAPNQRPFDFIRHLMYNAVSRKHNDPCYLCYETTKGYHFRSLASMYAQPSVMKYESIVAGTRSKKGAVDIAADMSSLLEYNIVSTQDSLITSRMGAYASRLYVHDIISKSYQKHTYNYIDNFKNEHHIESTNSKFRGDNLDDFPIVSDVIITKDNKRISDFPSRTFVQPTSGSGNSNTQVDEFNSPVFTSNAPELWIQKRNSQMEQLKVGYTVTIQVNGNTGVAAGDIVDINLPYTASTKTTKDEKYDNIYKGKFLITKLRHDFSMVDKSHVMNMEAVKDSLPYKLPSSNNPEIVDEVVPFIEDNLY